MSLEVVAAHIYFFLFETGGLESVLTPLKRGFQGVRPRKLAQNLNLAQNPYADVKIGLD